MASRKQRQPRPQSPTGDPADAAPGVQPTVPPATGAPIADTAQAIVSQTATIGSHASGDIPVQEIPVRANLTAEYVSGQPFVMLQSYLRSLPFYVDDITAAFGDDLYDRMGYDPVIWSSTMLLVFAALGQGLQLTPAVRKDEPDFDLASELAAFVETNLNAMSSQPHRWLAQIAEGVAYGNKVAEKIYRSAEPAELTQFTALRARARGAGLMLGALKVKPRHAYAFVTDIYNNLVGLLGLQPGKGISVLAQTLLTAQMVEENLLPREKFVVFTHLPMDEDPRGRSCRRPAYNAWFAKSQAYGEYLKYLAQWGSPGIQGETPEKAVSIPTRNPDGSYVLDANGRPVTVDPETRLVSILESYRSGACIAVPHGTNVSPFEPAGATGGGDVFLKAFAYFDQEMARAILGQTLATGEGQHDSRAAASVHQDVLELFVTQLKRELEATVQQDVIRDLVRINYGEDVLHLAPRASLGDVTQQDLAALMASVAQLQTSGYLDPSQYPEMDARMGLPVRVVDEDAGDGGRETEDGGGAPPPPEPPASGDDGKPAQMRRLDPDEVREYLGFGRLARELRAVNRPDEMRRAA